MLSLQSLTTPLTTDEAKAFIYETLATLGVSTTSWKPGAVVRTIIAIVAIIVAAFSRLTSSIARSGFLELSSGDWLTLVARHVYGVERQEATFADGEITLTNASGGVYTLDPDDLVFSNPSTGKTYRNTEAFTLGALETVTIPIRAVESGAASTSPPNTITVLETPLNGVTCTNPTAVVGLDAESDAVLRARCLEKLGALSPNGPWDAYAYAARNAKRSDGISVGVTRVRVRKDGYGNVTTYVATASGAVTGDANDPETDLGAVNDAIQRNAAPLAVTAWVESAEVVTVNVTYQVWVYTTVNLTDEELKAAISQNLSAFVASQPIGGNVIGFDRGKIFLDALRATISSTRPEIFHVVVSAPSSDVELDINQIMVLGTVTGTIHRIVPQSGEGGF